MKMIMKKYTLREVKEVVSELAKKINAPSSLLPTFGFSKDFAYPHIEVDKNGNLHFVVVERGKEIERKTTSEIDELLYWIFEDIVFSMASEYELNNRVTGMDTRRILFNKQVELLGMLSESWQQKLIYRHESILKNSPFNDTL